MNATRSLSVAALAAACLLTLSACAPDTAAETPKQEQEAEAPAFPRTIDIPAGRGGEASTLTIEAEPKAIAALDYESAEVIAELGLADRLVLVPEAVLNPAIGGHVDEMADVPATFPVAMNLDTETVIAASPDLVVMSPRHGAEESIGSVLEQAGLTSLQLPESWTSPETLTQNVDLIGQATGAEDRATQLTDDLASGLTEHAAKTPGAKNDDAPRVLVLTNQAGRPFITAGSAYPLTLLDLAGAKSVSGDLGIETTGPISAEQIVEAAPDGIVLIDMNGTGDRMFSELLGNPAIAAMPAATGEGIVRVTGRDVQALGLTSTVDGLTTLTDWVSTLS